MANNMDTKILVQNIINGSFCENLCRICLLPLDAVCENIFTKVFKEGKEYCAADILKDICRIELSDKENYSICSDCFIIASAAYKFYLMAHRSEEILQFYIDQLQLHLNSLNIPEQESDSSICISLPICNPKTKNFDFDLEGLAMFGYSDNESISTYNSKDYLDTEDNKIFDENVLNYKDSEPIEIEKTVIKKEKNDLNDIVIVTEKNGETSFFKPDIDGILMQVNEVEKQNFKKVFALSSQHDVVLKDDKKRRMRNPMSYRCCSKCPVKYRFVAKLKEHMKREHNIDLFVCKVCNATIDGEQEFDKHLEEHTNMHRCTICNTVFKKQDTIIAHLKKHEEEMKINTEGRHICEICGQLLHSDNELKEHYDIKHKKKFTCFYCGRMYKGEFSFELHVKKHETYINKNVQKDKKKQEGKTAERDNNKTRYPCKQCGKDFVDERALTWHLRLHNNQRPYVCQECGRAFVSLNRRNQHALCAHTAPARRCPLCPALFHLRSMVNTHIKKVHLNSHKRRNRTSKYQQVSWRTETVPIQELSVEIQNDLLELQTSQQFSETKYGT